MAPISPMGEMSIHWCLVLKASYVFSGDSYLYWGQAGDYPGLYRTDLASLPASFADKSSYLTLEPFIDDVTAFTLGYTDYRIYVPDESLNTMMSYALDGSDPKNLRSGHIENRDYLQIRSMVCLYWVMFLYQIVKNAYNFPTSLLSQYIEDWVRFTNIY